MNKFNCYKKYVTGETAEKMFKTSVIRLNKMKLLEDYNQYNYIDYDTACEIYNIINNSVDIPINITFNIKDEIIVEIDIKTLYKNTSKNIVNILSSKKIWSHFADMVTVKLITVYHIEPVS